jgi:hypothetical protein
MARVRVVVRSRVSGKCVLVARLDGSASRRPVINPPLSTPGDPGHVAEVETADPSGWACPRGEVFSDPETSRPALSGRREKREP